MVLMESGSPAIRARILSVGEAARAIEEGTEHRYQLRHRFGESLLAQAVRSR